MSTTSSWRGWIARQWFWPAAAMLIALDVLVVKRLSVGAEPWLVEAGLLGDWCIVAPLLYLCCFRRDGKRAVLRALGLACLGFWMASHLLPARDDGLVDQLKPLRYLGLGVLLVIELRVLFAVYRAVFRGAPVEVAAEHLEKQLGMPRWAARFAAMEAAFWRRVGTFIRELFRRP